MIKSFKYRLWTNENQERELSISLESHRRLYNHMLLMRIAAWECDRVRVEYVFQSRCFTGMRKENAFMARLNFASAQSTMRRLDSAYQSFFRRVKEGKANPGFPRFKGMGRFDSITFPSYGDGIGLNGNRLRVHGVGIIKVNLHRAFQGKIKTVTIKMEDDKWFAILACDLGEIKPEKSVNNPVGIDVGIESFLTTSDGTREANPRFLKSSIPKLRKLGRSVSRKKKHGSNRRKSARALRRQYVRVRNLRLDFHHKIARKLVDRYGFIAVERLNVQGMIKNHRLSRSISDAGWSAFGSILKSKAESAGVEVVEVNAAYTSQECSGCGKIVRKELSQRWHNCECGCSLHRDVNAAKNILARGLARTEPAGVNVGHKAKRFPRSRRLTAME